LSRFYGLHRVKLPRGRKIHFVVMNNIWNARIFCAKLFLLLFFVFVLLFSTVDAHYSPFNYEWIKAYHPF